MHENYSVINLNTGERIADCATLEDAKMMVSFSPANRAYRKNRFIVDQVIDITSTTDKQLPGQQGLPAAKIRLEDAQQQLQLRGSYAEVFVP